ncbi:MAG: hypothetical protein COV36_08230 [Alphaproteobacteria bacterium CG11_big_fil_rev_8_21_14_0_20_44_7]|nr:MAG: hypothetical protein COV36_08230 [Alphaproteobacteria bacterium CG11_big_fil_rev_8_21_14_0_20_44_7]
MAVGLYAIISVGSNSKKAEKADKKPASTLHQRAEDYVEEATKGWKDSSIHKVEPLSPSFAQRQDGKEGGLAGKATERLAQQPESSRVLGS